MTFYVEKRLALGPIRFGVSAPRPLEAIEGDPSLSTGARGEFLRKKTGGFYFADVARIAGPTLPTTRSVTATPFLDSLKPDGTRRGWGFLALMAGGVFFVLLGMAVLVRKGAAGWVEIVLGLAMIATPIVMTAQRRKQLREKEERERAEREAIETRNRKMLGDYTAALDRLRGDRGDEALSVLERERTALTLPYEIWGPSARDAIVRIGFDELAKRGVARAGELATLLDRASSAAGLSPDDAQSVKRDLYETVVWHLLADDRLGDAQEAELATLREGLGVPDTTARTVEEFRRLQTLDRKSLRKIDSHELPLTFREICVYRIDSDDGPLFVTNKRVVQTLSAAPVPPPSSRPSNSAGMTAALQSGGKAALQMISSAKKPIEIDLPKIDEITVDADNGTLHIRTDNPKKPLHAKVADSVYTAAVIDLAGGLDVKPKGFA